MLWTKDKRRVGTVNKRFSKYCRKSKLSLTRTQTQSLHSQQQSLVRGVNTSSSPRNMTPSQITRKNHTCCLLNIQASLPLGTSLCFDHMAELFPASLTPPACSPSPSPSPSPSRFPAVRLESYDSVVGKIDKKSALRLLELCRVGKCESNTGEHGHQYWVSKPGLSLFFSHIHTILHM